MMVPKSSIYKLLYMDFPLKNIQLLGYPHLWNLHMIVVNN